MPREPMQLPLFRRLPVPTDHPTPAGRRPRSRSPGMAALQLAFDFVLRALERDDIDDAWEFPAHRWISAASAEPLPPVSAPRSVFDLASGLGLPDSARERQRMLREQDRATAAEHVRGQTPSPASSVVRTAAGVRVIGAQYPAARWTPEREEAERARRARQKPPKPVKKARTRSKKLLELIGGEQDQE